VNEALVLVRGHWSFFLLLLVFLLCILLIFGLRFLLDGFLLVFDLGFYLRLLGLSKQILLELFKLDL
jgi:hypothetical protein